VYRKAQFNQVVGCGQIRRRIKTLGKSCEVSCFGAQQCCARLDGEPHRQNCAENMYLRRIVVNSLLADIHNTFGVWGLEIYE